MARIFLVMHQLRLECRKKLSITALSQTSRAFSFRSRCPRTVADGSEPGLHAELGDPAADAGITFTLSAFWHPQVAVGYRVCLGIHLRLKSVIG